VEHLETVNGSWGSAEAVSMEGNKPAHSGCSTSFFLSFWGAILSFLVGRIVDNTKPRNQNKGPTTGRSAKCITQAGVFRLNGLVTSDIRIEFVEGFEETARRFRIIKGSRLGSTGGGQALEGKT